MVLFEKRRNRIIAQVLLWVSLLGAMGLMFLGTDLPTHFYYRNLIHIVIALIIIALNSFVLIPRFFATKKYSQYSLSVLLCLLVLVSVGGTIESRVEQRARAAYLQEQAALGQEPNEPFFQRGRRGAMKPPGPIDPKYFLSFIIYAAIFLVGAVLESVQLYRKQEYQATQAQNEKLETELKFLKSQINPHFLFNVLNNVYTLSLIQSEQTPEMVMKLSEMLRYMLYDSNQERVSLGQEVAYIQNYTALQQLKDDEQMDVKTVVDVAHPEVRLAPMILIPFIENSFKHSKIEDTVNGWIRIELQADKNEIQLRVSNSKPTENYTKDSTGGIGLKNVRRRLELEYPNKHELSVEETETQFVIHLLIQLT